MELLDIGRVLLGLVLLIGGGEVLVRGASTLATKLGIPPLVVGLVIVSAATSAPELAVTIGSVIDEEPGLAVGNVVGSNIANVLLILGLSALFLPLSVKRRLVKFDLPVMVGISILLLVLALDGEITQIDGVILFAAAVAHVVLSFTLSKRDPDAAPGDAAAATAPAATGPVRTRRAPASGVLSYLIPVVLILAGIGLLVFGADLLVTGAVAIATGFGVSSLVIGLTVVAIGTSLPELATSIAAVRRGERDLAVGNIVGSNIFNIGVVLGLPAIFFPAGIPVPDAAISLDIPLMIAAAVALMPIAFTGFTVARWEGAVFVALYVAYTVYLILAAVEHDALRGFSIVMLFFVLPLLAVTLIAVTAYEVGLRRGRRESPTP
ncbi:calcium/sodium antiporter [Microbacterium aurantiacum]|uniref:calcium/sodium antiporter n=1 Tax=Microbacterium aurantiacum TaxID=162393 RepID=UPI003D7619DD